MYFCTRHFFLLFIWVGRSPSWIDPAQITESEIWIRPRNTIWPSKEEKNNMEFGLFFFRFVWLSFS